MFKQGDDNITKPTVISLDQLQREEEPEKPFLSPQEEGEISVSGSMPDPESDDDTLQNEKNVGHQVGESVEHPEELNDARDTDRAEEYQKTH